MMLLQQNIKPLLPDIIKKYSYSTGPKTGLFTDGSAIPNPGPGGWGMVPVIDNQIIKELYGRDPNTTNNRMELTAIINAYKILDPDSDMTIYSDSNLCVQTVNTWAAGWEKRGWKKAGGHIANLELVKEMYYLSKERPRVKLEWIKAHNGWLWNEYADGLSNLK